jgi:hypothetical protein
MRAAVHHVLTSVALPWAATPSPSPSTSTGPNPDTVSPGLLGFLSFLFLIVAVYFIGRGLTKQLKRVNFDEDAATAAMLGEAPADGVDLGPRSADTGAEPAPTVGTDDPSPAP